MHPRGDLHHLLVRGVGQALELQHTALPLHVHAIERERMEVHVQPQRPVAALHERDRTDLGPPALREDERVLEMVPYHADEVDESSHFVTVTEKGYIKRTQLSEFANMRKTGLIAVVIDEDDRLMLDDGDKREDEAGVVARAGEVSTEHVEASEPDEPEPEASDE